MTLKELIRRIEATAQGEPAVHTIVRDDVYKLDRDSVARYGVFAWTQGQHQQTGPTSGVRQYALTLYYIDRLRDDEANQLDVQSVGIEVLTNILRKLASAGLPTSGWAFQPFTQKFADLCAGIYVSVTFTAPTGGNTCGHSYAADFNDDFNDDFYTL